MPYLSNNSRIIPPRLVTAPGPVPQLQAHAVKLTDQESFGVQLDRVLNKIAAGSPDLIEIHCGTAAFSMWQQWLKDQRRDDSEPVMIGPGGLEITVFYRLALPSGQMVVMSYRARN